MVEPAERTLADALTKVRHENSIEGTHVNYHDALQALAQLADPLEQFFTDIMVMTEDEGLKNNRLALLAELQVELGRVADISLLAR